MENSKSQTPDSIIAVFEQVKQLSGVAADFSKMLTQVVSSEFEYDFVVNSDMRDSLVKAANRMVIAKLGFLHPDNNDAFEDISRSIHLQMEGMINTWFEQVYLSKRKLSQLPYDFAAIKLEAFFTRYSPAGQPSVNMFPAFQKKLGELSLTIDVFIQDYFDMSISDFKSKYLDDIFLSIKCNFDLFVKRVFKIDISNGIKRLGFTNKAEFIFLHYEGVWKIFTYSISNRLNEYRNILSHSGGIAKQGDACYTYLVSKPERITLVYNEFLWLYNIVKNDCKHFNTIVKDL